jgi:hypothetical protein
MTGKKLDFSITRNGQIEAVKARIFKGWNGDTFAQLDGGIFNGWEPGLAQLDEVIALLLDVREAVGKGADAKST